MNKQSYFWPLLAVALLQAPFAQAIYSNQDQSVPGGAQFRYQGDSVVYSSSFFMPSQSQPCKTAFSSPEMAETYANQFSKIISVSSSLQLSACSSNPDAQATKLPPSGTIYKQIGASAVYLFRMRLSGNQSVPDPYVFTSLDDFTSKGYNLKQIFVFKTEDVSQWGASQNWYRPDDTVFRYSGDATVYGLANGKKTPFVSTLEALTLIPNKNYIVTLPAQETYPTEGQYTMLFGGSYVVKGSGPQVYLVSVSQLRPIHSMAALKNLGFATKDIVRFPDDVINKMPVGPMIF